MNKLFILIIKSYYVHTWVLLPPPSLTTLLYHCRLTQPSTGSLESVTTRSRCTSRRTEYAPNFVIFRWTIIVTSVLSYCNPSVSRLLFYCLRPAQISVVILVASQINRFALKTIWRNHRLASIDFLYSIHTKTQWWTWWCECKSSCFSFFLCKKIRSNLCIGYKRCGG